MVSKIKVSGKSALVFVSVGTTKFQFHRLFSAIDQSLGKHGANISLVVQTGNSQYQWQHKDIKLYKYMTPSENLSYIRKADKTILHSGFATVYLAAKQAKNNPLIVPRLEIYQEHVDNHQLLFTRFLRNKLPPSLKKYLLVTDDIHSAIERYLIERPIKNILQQYLFLGADIKKVLRGIKNYIDHNML